MLSSEATNATNPRVPRKRNANKKKRIQKALADTILGSAGIELVGRDPLLEKLLTEGRPPAPTSSAYQILMHGEAVSIIGVPDRIWFDVASMRRLNSVRLRMSELGRNCAIVPYSALQSARADGESMRATLARALTTPESLFGVDDCVDPWSSRGIHALAKGPRVLSTG